MRRTLLGTALYSAFYVCNRTKLNNDERSAVQNAGDRARTRLGDVAGLAGYLKWPVFVGFSRTVNNPLVKHSIGG